MIALFSTIFMESYTHFKVMLIALPWGNLFGAEGASAFLVVLVFTLPEPHLIYVAAFSFCSNFQPDFSKVSVDFMNLCHLTPSWPSGVGNHDSQTERPAGCCTIKPEREWRNEPGPQKSYALLNRMEEVLTNLCKQWTFYFQLAPWGKVVHWVLCSKILSVCKKNTKRPDGQRAKGTRKPNH